MIPHIIHCCWFGDSKTKLALKCRASWERFARLGGLAGLDGGQRVTELDCIRALAIWFVVFGHALCHLHQSPFLIELIYSFHMPVLFAVSGFAASLVWAKGETEPVASHALRRIGRSARRLLVPYALVGLVICPAWAVGALYLEQGVLDVHPAVGVWRAFFTDNHGLWFLPACFILICTQVAGEALGRRRGRWMRVAFGAGLIVPIALLYYFTRCDYLRSVMCYWFSFYTGVVLFRCPSLLVRPPAWLAAVAFSVWAILAVIFAHTAHTLLGNMLKPMSGLAALIALGGLAHCVRGVPLLADIGKSTLAIYCIDYICGSTLVPALSPANPVWSALYAVLFVLIVHFVRKIYIILYPRIARYCHFAL